MRVAPAHHLAHALWLLVAGACHPIAAVGEHERDDHLAAHSHTAQPPAGVGPLDDDARHALFTSPSDPPPVRLGGVTEAEVGHHYVTGNEHGLVAFAASIRDRGGGYLGVGSDQAYLLMGWARSEFAWLVDYDPVVVDLHGVYRALLLEAETPADFLALWSREGRVAAHAAIDAHAPDRLRTELRTLYRRHRAAIARRLQATRDACVTAATPGWLDDPAQYDHVRALVQHGRTRAMLADLAGTRGFAGITRAAEAAGIPIEVLYLSNAEEYWRLYPDAFRDNIAGLPFAADAVVLRTLLIWHVNRDYRYNVQRADNFRAWLAEPWVGNVYHVTYQRPATDPAGPNLFETTAWPADAPPVLRTAARRKIRELLAAGITTRPAQ